MTDSDPIVINSSLNSSQGSFRSQESSGDSAYGDGIQIDEFYLKCKQALQCLKTLDRGSLSSIQELLDAQNRRTQTAEKLLATIFQ